MTALVVLYMVDYLLLPPHVEQVAGLAALRAALESLFGPLSTQALASAIYGLYSGFVYFTPLLGGMIADRWTGQRNAVVIGALTMAAGHIFMSFDSMFLVALMLLIAGSGFLKGNISAQVGALYPSEDEARRNHGFVIFSTGINIGAVLGPLLCGLLAHVYGWHYGFGVAALFMLLGLATYLYGYRYLQPRVVRRKGVGTGLSKADWRIIGALGAVIVISILPSVVLYQSYNVMPVWIEQHVASRIGNLTIPVPWYQSIFALSSIVGVPLLFWIWKRQSARGREPNDVAKIGIGAGLATASILLLVGATKWSGTGLVSPIWPMLCVSGLGVAFLYYWPTLLALVSRAAPDGVNATMMGIVFMSLFISNNLIGWIGGFYERMGPLQFWLMHALIGTAGYLLVVLVGHLLHRELEPTEKV